MQKHWSLFILFIALSLNSWAMPPAIVTIASTDPLCLGSDNGSISINATGTGAITYSIDNGATFQSTSVFNNLPPGTYDVVVQDGTGTTTQQIILNYQITVVAAFTPSTINGAAILSVDFTNLSSGATTYQWNLDGANNNSTLIDPSFSYDTPGVFPVTLIAMNGVCRDTANNTITVTGQSQILDIPNVMSPNNDGINDVFVIPSIGLKTLEVFIYNRYGELVYEWFGKYGQWDGHTYPAGQPVPEGTYYYYYKAVGFDNVNYDDKGIITVLR